jgi:hypothetical protein
LKAACELLFLTGLSISKRVEHGSTDSRGGCPYTGTPGSGTAVLPCYVVTEDLIEYHWLTDPNPRVFQLGLLGSLASQMVVVKFGGVVVKGAPYAHYEVKVNR